MAFSLQLLHREDFEGRTLRALAGGAAVGVVAALGERFGIPINPGFAVVAAALAGARPVLGYSAALRLSLAVLPTLPYFFDGTAPVPQAFSGAIAAGLVGWIGQGGERFGKPSEIIAGAVASGALVPLGMYVQQVMDARFFPNGGLLGALLGFTAVALFWSVGTLASHVTFHVDPVESRGGVLENTLSGEALELVGRTLTLYRQCRSVAMKMAPGAGRNELVEVLRKMAREAFTLAESHAGLTAQLQSVAQGDVDAQVKDLRTRAAAAEDPVAKRQLELAASSLGEELNRLNTLSRKQERLLAQLHAQVALMERARVSLVGAAGTEASAKGAQAAHLAKRLAALGEDVPPAPESEQAAQPVSSTRVSS
ncbi:hypothetical protein [Hyalangium rubrum]|uniref:FUSC family protein n=1 Tax=Hyalangium rubrum TaxID=3103134 RepID=A0ABU5GYV5_9BACT|nr:hypothetical protein [Hyalangium sp. s54d21]MDY7226386.1 hypothetical protein [Hyalangium sp. s54d21]